MTPKTIWSATQATCLAGQEAIDTLDLVAIAMERKWGADRLRLLVDETLRTKFDRQRLLTYQAIIEGELADVIRETRRMANAWRTLDAAADMIPASHLPPTVWEVVLSDQTVVQIVRETEKAGLAAAQAVAQGRQVALYTLEEVGRILVRHQPLYPSAVGLTVTRVPMSVPDFTHTMGDVEP